MSAHSFISDYVDFPCGYIDLVVKKISTNNSMIGDFYLNVKLLSEVPKDKIMVDVQNKTDEAQSL